MQILAKDLETHVTCKSAMYTRRNLLWYLQCTYTTILLIDAPIESCSRYVSIEFL